MSAAMVIVIRRALLRLACLAVLPVAVVASDPAPLRAATCAQVRNEIAQLNEQLKQDQSALNQWCANTLSLQCQEQGPGMRERIKILGDEISADRLQLITACAPPPPPPPKGLTVTDVSPDTPYGAAAGGGPASGGRIHTLVLDQSGGNAVLYAASENAGVWKSTDGGRNWSQASIGLRNTHAIWNNHVLALDSSNPKRLLYATDADDGRVRQNANGVSVQPYAGLYVSTDGAATWRPAERSATPGTIGGLCPGTEGNISSVAFSSGQPFAVTPCGWFTNSDPGLADGHWVAVPGVPQQLQNAIIAPNNYGNSLFACRGNLVYRSVAQTWSNPIDLGFGNTCWGLSVVQPSAATATADSVAVIYADTAAPRAGVHTVILEFASGSKTDLQFNGLVSGSGLRNIFAVRRASALPSDTGPGIAYDVYAADGFHFFVYLPKESPRWKPLVGLKGDLHADSWSMAFPSTYDPEHFICTAFVANDGGIFANSSQALTFFEPPPGPEPTPGHLVPPPGERETGPPPIPIGCNPSAGWVAAMSGLHTLATWGIAGVTQTAQCAGNEACPTLYLAQGDNDVFAVQQGGAISGPLNDYLGDAGEIHVDPAFPKQVVTTRQLLLSAVISTGDGPPGPGAMGSDITPSGVDAQGHKINLLTGGSAGPLNPGMTQVMALDGESNLSPLYFAIAGTPAQPDRIISNNANPPTSQTWETAETGSAVGMFPHGTVAQLRATGGLRNPVLWLLTTGGKVYKSAVTNGKVSQWEQVSGLGKIGSVFVNPYNPNYAWAMDFQDASIKMTTTGGTNWAPAPALKAIATNKGEYRFDCGWTSDVEFFDWTCSLGWMSFSRIHPNVVVAALFPGGVAYSNDKGVTWKPLPGATSDSPQTQPAQQNLHRLPVSVWYDDNPVTGRPSIYVGLNGRGIMRVDGDFDALPAE